MEIILTTGTWYEVIYADGMRIKFEFLDILEDQLLCKDEFGRKTTRLFERPYVAIMLAEN